MNLRLNGLSVSFKRGVEEIPFTDINYFHGQMGAGKSSIARLIDYCLGGNLEYTPALQSEFIAATLFLNINGHFLAIERQAETTQIRAHWTEGGEEYDLVLPATKANGEVLPNTGIEVLSDLLFRLGGIRPPKVRRGKQSDESELVRLSFRDLFWYCFLEQESMDSSFFNLDADAPFYLRNKSRDVLGFILGFHQERVSELEVELEELRTRRAGLLEGAKVLQEALINAGFGSEKDILLKITTVESAIAQIESGIQSAREKTEEKRTHAVELLRFEGRRIASELEAIESAISEVEKVVLEDRRHHNELITLTYKFKRVLSARSVLNGVEFLNCPRCAQKLPPRENDHCDVCGQDLEGTTLEAPELSITEKDSKARIAELKEIISHHETQLGNLRQRLTELQKAKWMNDSSLDDAMRLYDSAYLSSMLEPEKKRAALKQELSELQRSLSLPRIVSEQREEADRLTSDVERVRRELKEVRAGAERDMGNLRKLEELFLDCLIRAKVTGFSTNDVVQIRPPDFRPQVISPETGDMIITSFANLGSGGKKTLFKCCFAIAVHRLAAEIDADLPKLMIIDSPMKNISERENRAQFEAFHQLIYELAGSELRGTQFVLIDKEYCEPSDTAKIKLSERHMEPNSDVHPPLIKYYKGH